MAFSNRQAKKNKELLQMAKLFKESNCDVDVFKVRFDVESSSSSKERIVASSSIWSNPFSMYGTMLKMQKSKNCLVRAFAKKQLLVPLIAMSVALQIPMPFVATTIVFAAWGAALTLHLYIANLLEDAHSAMVELEMHEIDNEISQMVQSMHKYAMQAHQSLQLGNKANEQL